MRSFYSCVLGKFLTNDFLQQLQKLETIHHINTMDQSLPRTTQDQVESKPGRLAASEAANIHTMGAQREMTPEEIIADKCEKHQYAAHMLREFLQMLPRQLNVSQRQALNFILCNLNL